MKGQRFSEEQIIAVLKESEAGAKTKEHCRRHGVSEPTFYNWKANYARLPAAAVCYPLQEVDWEARNEKPPAVSRRGSSIFSS